MKEKISVKDLTISPPLALAPMVGLTHSALRSLLVELGGIGLLYTEMLSANRLPGDDEKTSPFLIRSKEESPLIYQIYTADVNNIESAFDKIHSLGAQGIDLNLGCPAPKLRRQGAGGYLGKNREQLGKIIGEMRRRTHLVLSAKIRVEFPEDTEFADYCRFLEDCGIDLLAVHARLPKEKFCRKPKWAWVKKAKENVKIPVFANGGIFSVDDAEKCIDISGADGLMIGRGAAVSPWIFKEINNHFFAEGEKQKIDRMEIFERFFTLLIERFPQERQLGRLKQFTTLFAETFAYGHLLATSVQRSHSMEEAFEKAAIFFEKHNDEVMT